MQLFLDRFKKSNVLCTGNLGTAECKSVMIPVHKTFPVVSSAAIGKHAQDSPIVPFDELVEFSSDWPWESSSRQDRAQGTSQMNVECNARLVKINLCKHEISRKNEALSSVPPAFRKSKSWGTSARTWDGQNGIGDPV